MMSDDTKFVGTPSKATTHVNQNEGLIFEKSSPGKKAYRLAVSDVPAIDADPCWARACAAASA